MIHHLDDIAETIARETGKTRVEALSTELLPAIVSLSYYIKNAKKFLRPRKLAPAHIAYWNKRSILRRVPFGVIGVISPWNYPFGIPFPELVMGLLAGNAVVLKVATETQMVGLAIRRCMEAARLPEGVFAFLNIPGRIAGDAFLEAGVDKLFFTGSVAVGRQLMSKASESLTPVCLELGGNDPMLVCEDADLARAAHGAVWAGFSNAGQSCGGVERVYVHRDVYDPFLKLVRDRVETLRVGYDQDFGVDMGAMTTLRQWEQVQRHVDEALARGAEIFCQSKIPEANSDKFFPATVLTNVDHTMPMMKEETFGPVMGVMGVDSMDTAVALANDSELGLSASVWSKNLKKAVRIAGKIRAGAVMINDHLMSHGQPETPWGGFKHSGIGRTHGEIGFNEMTQPQVIVNDMMSFAKKDPWWHPYSKELYEGIKGIAYLSYARGLRRFSGRMNLARLMARMFKEG
jgi:succinate-semialdehyde dehydrogenase/glutarate-semialdehyde dehydrogenase